MLFSCAGHRTAANENRYENRSVQATNFIDHQVTGGHVFDNGLHDASRIPANKTLEPRKGRS